MQIKDYLDRFEIMFPDNETLKDYRRAYNDKDLSSIFRILDNEELRKAVMDENIHSIFRLIEDDLIGNIDYEDFRKSVVEKNIHSIFRLLENMLLNENIDFSDLRKAVLEQNLHSIFRFVNNEDLRKAVVEKNLHSLFRVEPNDNLRKLVLEDNINCLWDILNEQSKTTFVQSLKYIHNSNTEFDHNSFSRGQLKSKIWLIDELEKLNLNLGVVFLCAGWYATLATMLFEKDFQLIKIRSFDIDPSCADLADRFNKPWVLQDWKFKASTKDILDIDYHMDFYEVKKSDGSLETCKDKPDTIINTSCEHIENFEDWYSKLPNGKLLILQTNNYFEIDDHVNCSESLESFANQTPMSKCLFQGELDLVRYKRFMRIGYK